MTRRAYATQARILRSVRGETCVRAETGAYAWSLLLDFGTLQAPDADGYRAPAYGLVVECPWRLEDRTQVVAGSNDDAETVDARLQLCVGRRLTRVVVYQPSFMVHIYLEDGLSLWVFPDNPRDYAASTEPPYSAWYVAGHKADASWED